MTATRWITVIAAVSIATVAVVAVKRLVSPVIARQVAPLPPSTSPQRIGVAGCSGSACHGGQLSNDDCKSPFAATLWLNYDRHAHAFTVLLGRDASRIMQALNPGEPHPATSDARCLACHTDPTTVYAPGERTVDNSDAAWAARREGVGCEACHGNGTKFLLAHAGWSGEPGTLRSRYQQHDMTWLNDLGTRADLCAGCHVGAPADSERRLPLRNVTHEMIAAGHPRLAFELTSYQRMMPVHWIERDRTLLRKSEARGGQDDAWVARAWLEGQIANGIAAARLLQDTAGRPEWPELARFDCYSCHHHLALDGWRQKDSGPPPGGLRRNAWDLSLLLGMLATRDEAQRTANDLFATLDQQIYLLDRPAITSAALGIEQKLVSLREKLRDVNQTQPDVLLGTVLRDLMADEKELAHLHWDDAAQLCLALSAWRDASGGGPEDFAAKLKEFADIVRFPSDNGHSWGGPRGYSPAQVSPKLKPLRDLLNAWVERRSRQTAIEVDP
jgi:hypothetical protein